MSLTPYRTYRPTNCDTPGLGCEDRQDWLVAPVSITRDSECLGRSNWSVVTGDVITRSATEDWEIHRFGHWACGWFEIMLVRPGSMAHMVCDEWSSALEDYPIASDDHFSELEYSEACEYWERASLRERVYECQRAGVSVFAARRDECPERVLDRLRDAL